MEGKRTQGASSPANPALIIPEPLSIITVRKSSDMFVVLCFVVVIETEKERC
jgi:hypothetical protein